MIEIYKVIKNKRVRDNYEVLKIYQVIRIYKLVKIKRFTTPARTVPTAEKKLVQITGTALFPGGICPELPVICGGSAVIFGVKRRIEQGTKARNPDGSVNYTEVMLV